MHELRFFLLVSIIVHIHGHILLDIDEVLVIIKKIVRLALRKWYGMYNYNQEYMQFIIMVWLYHFSLYTHTHTHIRDYHSFLGSNDLSLDMFFSFNDHLILACLLDMSFYPSSVSVIKVGRFFDFVLAQGNFFFFFVFLGVGGWGGVSVCVGSG